MDKKYLWGVCGMVVLVLIIGLLGNVASVQDKLYTVVTHSGIQTAQVGSVLTNARDGDVFNGLGFGNPTSGLGFNNTVFNNEAGYEFISEVTAPLESIQFSIKTNYNSNRATPEVFRDIPASLESRLKSGKYTQVTPGFIRLSGCDILAYARDPQDPVLVQYEDRLYDRKTINNKVSTASCYSTKTGGSFHFEVRSGLSGTVLARSKTIANPRFFRAEVDRFQKIFFEKAPVLQKGQTYAIVVKQETPELGSFSINDFWPGSAGGSEAVSPYWKERGFKTFLLKDTGWQEQIGLIPNLLLNYAQGVVKGSFVTNAVTGNEPPVLKTSGNAWMLTAELSSNRIVNQVSAYLKFTGTPTIKASVVEINPRNSTVTRTLASTVYRASGTDSHLKWYTFALPQTLQLQARGNYGIVVEYVSGQSTDSVATDSTYTNSPTGSNQRPDFYAKDGLRALEITNRQSAKLYYNGQLPFYSTYTTTGTGVTNNFQSQSEEYILAIASSVAKPNDTITISWFAPLTANIKNDWIALYKKGDSNENYNKDAWKYISDTTRGTMTFTLPALPGEYELRYLKNDGYNSVANATIVIQSETVSEPLIVVRPVVTRITSYPRATDSIELTTIVRGEKAFVVGRDLSDVRQYSFTNATSGVNRIFNVPASQSAARSSFSFTTPGLSPGAYTFQAIDSSGVASEPVPVTVVLAPKGAFMNVSPIQSQTLLGSVITGIKFLLDR